jgi:hypothetical protein
MAHQRLRHDVAAATAKAVLEIVAPCLRPEEQHEAWGMFLTAITAGLEKYEELRQRELHRLARPSDN